jgi:hypothetical protein
MNRHLVIFLLLFPAAIVALGLLFFVHSSGDDWGVQFTLTNLATIPLGVLGIYWSWRLMKFYSNPLGIFLFLASILITYPVSSYVSAWTSKYTKPLANQYITKDFQSNDDRQRQKQVNYDLISKLFRKPQKVLAVRDSRILLESGIQVYLYSSPTFRFADRYGMDEVLTKELLHKTVQINLPIKDDFFQVYEPGSGLLAFTEAVVNTYGDVPALVYNTKGKLVNPMDDQSDPSKLKKYIKK